MEQSTCPRSWKLCTLKIVLHLQSQILLDTGKNVVVCKFKCYTQIQRCIISEVLNNPIRLIVHVLPQVSSKTIMFHFTGDLQEFRFDTTTKKIYSHLIIFYERCGREQQTDFFTSSFHSRSCTGGCTVFPPL
jgi:hypothetical protein